MGTAYGIYPCGSALVMGKIDGETFLGRLLIFFFGGAGEEKRNSRARNAETFSQDDASSEQPCVYMLYIICWAGEVSLLHASGHRAKCPRPRRPGQRTCAVQASTARRPSLRIDICEGVVAPRSATDST